MFEKNDKRRLYWLIDQYLLGKLDARAFCDEYYYCYDLELDTNLLSKLEKNVFSGLSGLINRFSEFPEDLKNHPGTYFNEEQLFKKACEAKQRLNLTGNFYNILKK